MPRSAAIVLLIAQYGPSYIASIDGDLSEGYTHSDMRSVQ